MACSRELRCRKCRKRPEMANCLIRHGFVGRRMPMSKRRKLPEIPSPIANRSGGTCCAGDTTMSDSELCFTPATELVDAIRARKVSVVEITTAVLARISRLEPRLNAFAYLAAEEAMDSAQAADRTLANGQFVGPLHGVPVTIKDHEAVGGMQIEYGTHLRRGDVAVADSAMVSRLRRAGAIILGKTATPEFGWMGVSNSPLTGVTHNPWKLGLNAGASSAGAGVGAAAGYGPLHQGSDGAGSIRMPAHFCGVYGIKPSFGRVPYYPVGTGDLTSHMGPMTRTVADGALMLELMAGPHHLDYTTLEAWPAAYSARLSDWVKGKKIAYSPDLGVA